VLGYDKYRRRQPTFVEQRHGDRSDVGKSVVEGQGDRVGAIVG
jgi:hypothetical protein